MKPLDVIYWVRVVLGVLAGAICALFDIFVERPIPPSMDWNVLFRGLSLALLIYVITYYVMKPIFVKRVKKPSKVFTMGIGVYFAAWIVFWALFYTLFGNPPLPPQSRL